MRRFLTTLVLGISLFSPFLQAAPVDINTASAEQLAAALSGVGQVRAEAIVQYREEHGPFTSVEQLLQVQGIGEATLEKNRDQLLLPSATVAAE